jgi:16S rRNA (cytosine967-C5)-methyltransferase
MPANWTGCCLAEQARGARAAGQLDPRAAAAQLLFQLTGGKSLSLLLETGMGNVARGDLGLVKELCFGVARWQLRLEQVTRLLVGKPLKKKDGDILALIHIGLYQLLHMRIPAHAALAETVNATRVLGKPWASGLVNAVLRRFLRERERLLVEADKSDQARLAHPAWLIEGLRNAWPDRWLDVLEANNLHPPMSLRVNLKKTTRADYLALLAETSIGASPIPHTDAGIVLDQPMPADALPNFREGQVSVQDGGAQLAAELLDLQPGHRVLDACAAPGGKTGQLMETAPGPVELTAVDIDERRLKRVRENLDRLGFRAGIRAGDASRPIGDWAETLYDRILLDVPCSATGVIRRHPDIKLLRRADDIPALVATQARILDAIWPLLKPGGLLLYATCSLLPEENQRQVSRFLTKCPGARLRPIDAAWGHPADPGRQTLPGESTMDGFYYACLEKPVQ